MELPTAMSNAYEGLNLPSPNYLAREEQLIQKLNRHKCDSNIFQKITNALNFPQDTHPDIVIKQSINWLSNRPNLGTDIKAMYLRPIFGQPIEEKSSLVEFCRLCPNVKKLTIEDLSLSPNSLQDILSAFPNLKSLELLDVTFPDSSSKEVSALINHPNLTSLWFTRTGGKVDFDALPQLPGLKRFSAKIEDVEKEVASILTSYPNIESIEFSDFPDNIRAINSLRRIMEAAQEKGEARELSSLIIGQQHYDFVIPQPGQLQMKSAARAYV